MTPRWNLDQLLGNEEFVFGLARALVADRQTAEDVSQQAWLAAMKTEPGTIRSPRAWLRGTVRKIVLRMRRDESRRRTHERAAAPREAIRSTEEFIEREEIRGRVVKALLDMEEPYQMTILLRFYEQLSPGEIAAHLDIPLETVRTRLKRGLARLRATLDADCRDGRIAWRLALAPLAGMQVLAPSGGTGAVVAAAARTTASSSQASGWTTLLSGTSFMSAKVKIAATLVLVMAAAAVIVVLQPDRFLPDRSVHPAVGTNDSTTNEPPAATVDEDPSRRIERQLIDPADAASHTSLCGRITDFAGRPLAGVSICTTSCRSVNSSFDPPIDAAWSDTNACTDPDGFYRIALVRDELPLSFLQFTHPDFQTRTVPLALAVPGYDGSWIMEEVSLTPCFSVRGLVKGPDGEPAPGCRVSWATGRWTLEASRTLDRTDTGPDGCFRLTLPRDKPVIVTAYHESLGSGWSSKIKPAAGKNAPAVTILLEKGGSLSGRLLHSDDRPARGEKLIAQAEINGLWIERSAVTDRKGRFLFSRLPDGLFRIVFKGFGVRGNMGGKYSGKSWLRESDFILAEQAAPHTDNLLLTLPPASRLVIELKDHDNRPVARKPTIRIDQLVRESPDEENSCLHSFGWMNEIEKAGEGRIVLRNIQPGTYQITLLVPGFADRYLRDVIVPKPPEQGRVTCLLEPERRICGYVFFSEGEPAAGVAVTWELPWGTEPGTDLPRAGFRGDGTRSRPGMYSGDRVVTDENGFFRFSNLDRGEYSLCFSKDGHEVFRQSPVSVSDDNPQVELQITLPGLDNTIEGCVTDSRGKRLAGATVMAWNGADLFLRSRTDGEGRYRFAGLPDGSYLVDARVLAKAGMDTFLLGSEAPIKDSNKSSGQLIIPNAAVNGGTTCRLDLRIDDPWNGCIKGRVDNGSRPLPDDFRIRLSLHREGPYDSRANDPLPGDLFRPPHELRGCKDLDPRMTHFLFETLPAGQYRVAVVWDGAPAHFNISSKVIELPASMRRDLILKIGFASLQGRVIDAATGLGVQNARVVLMKRGNDRPRRTFRLNTGKDGSFTGENVPAGIYDLVVRHDRYSPFLMQDLEVRHDIDQFGLRFELVEGCTLHGRLNVDGDPCERRHFYIYPSMPPLGTRWDSRGGRVAEDRTFQLKGLPAGEVVLVVQVGSQPIFEKSVTLPLPQNDTVTIELPASVLETGREKK